LDSPAGIGSGELFRTGQGQGFGHQILTAGHNITGDAIEVRFDMQREAGVPVFIRINVPAGNQYQIRHPNYVGPPQRLNDIAILRLTDQDNPQPDRLLVAPFGAQQYGLYSGTNEVGQDFTLVGYGLTGTGNNGVIEGSAGTKRAGRNRFDGTGGVFPLPPLNRPMALVYDFDNGTDAYNALANPNIANISSNLGLGNDEAINARGDSGGPLFLGNAIAAVVSTDARFQIPNIPPIPEGGFGTVGFATRVSATIGGFSNVLNPASPGYNLVLDMNQQVLGKTNPTTGPLPLADNLTITAKPDGTDLVLTVGGSGTAFDGEYYRAPLANILSLTIRGSSDNETIKLQGPLRLGPAGSGSITLEGEGGQNTYIIGNNTTGDLGDFGGPITIDGGYQGASGKQEVIINDVAPTAGHTYTIASDSVQRDGAPTISLNTITSLTVNTGGGDDDIRIQSIQTGITTTVNGRSGNDRFSVGNNNSLDDLAGNTSELVLDGGGGNDNRLTLNDQATTTHQEYRLTAHSLLRQASAQGAHVDIGFSSFQSVTLNAASGGNEIDIWSTGANTTTTVNAGSGDDTANVHDNQRLDDIQGRLTINGQGGTNTLVLDDSRSARGQQYTRGANSLRRGNGPLIQFRDFRNVTIREGNQQPMGMGDLGNTTTVTGLDGAVEDNLFTGDGDDEVTFVLSSPLPPDKTVAINAGDGTDRIVVAQGELSTPQLTVDSVEELAITGGTLTLNAPDLGVLSFLLSSGTLSGTGQLSAADSIVWTGGVMCGDGKTLLKAGGTLTISGSETLMSRTLENDGDATWSGTISGGTGTVLNASSGTFKGGGSLAGQFANYGTLYPGDYGVAGAISVYGFTNAGTLKFDLADGSSDAITAKGPVVLGGSLDLNAPSTLTGTSYTIINNTGPGSVVGTFAGLSEGTAVNIGGLTLYGSYVGGDGNDVVLGSGSPPPPPAGAKDDDYTLLHDRQFSVPPAGVLSNDTDPGGNALSAYLSTGVSNGNLTLNTDGSFVYTPGTHFVGTDSFTYLVNRAPKPKPDYYAIVPGAILNGNVLGNDADPDGDDLTVTLDSDVAHGVLTLNNDGTFSYEPDEGFSGGDVFTYVANDGYVDSDPVTVSIQVSTLIFANPDSYEMVRNTQLSVGSPGVLGNDSSPNGPATAVLVSGPANGNLTLNANGSFTYTPSTGFIGSDSFTYQATDGTNTANPTSVTINVVGQLSGPFQPRDATATLHVYNTPPTAYNDSYTAHTHVLNVPEGDGVLANDVDADGDPLNAAVVTGPAHGSLNLNANGSFTYAVYGYSGSDSFTYQANDGIAHTGTATASIQITNQSPVAYNFSASTVVGKPVILDALAHANDPDHDPLTLTITGGPSHGAAVVNDNGTAADPTDDYIVYTSSNFTGIDTIVYQVDDGFGATATGTITITVDKGTPILNLTDSGGTYNGSPYPATATIAGVVPGVDDTPGASLEGVGLTLTYFAGFDTTGSALSGAPSKAGTYTVQVSFSGSTNYTAAERQLTFTISRAPLTVSATAQNKVYDGTTSATVALEIETIVSGDDVTPVYVGANFEDKNVGTGKTVTVSAITLIGADAGNYALQTDTATTTADITPKGLTVTATGQNKVYDGTTTATVNLSDNKIAGDSVTDNYTSANFNNKNVGTGKTVTANGISISGTDSGNYNLLNTTATTTADITKRDLTVSAAGVNRVYDGTTTATVNLSDNKIAGDSVTDNYTSANFNNKNVGTGKPVTANGISISGTDSGNYNLLNTTATTTADITAKTLTVSASASNKVYDGTTAATATLTLNGVVAGDTVSAAYTSAVFDNKNVGTGKTVTVNGISLNGADSGNYTVASTATTTANITAKVVTVTATAQNKVYDGTTSAMVSLTANGIVAGDMVMVTYTTANFDTPNVGVNKTVTVTGISLFGFSAGNYALQNTTATTTADITSSGGGKSPPIAVNDSGVTAMDTPVTINVLANDWDPNGDPLTIVSAGPAPHGNVQVNNNGTVTYTPFGGMGYQGIDSFQYQISDGHGGTATATVTVTVGQPQFFAGAEIATDAGSLTAEQLQPVVTEAIGQLRAAGYDVASLGQASFQITNLQAVLVGVTYQNTIWIDENAAGHGWYLGEVSGGTSSIDASGRVDLLTVVTHELGHVLGFASVSPALKPDNWMTATLPAGVRRLPDQLSSSQPFVANRFGGLPASMIHFVPANDWTVPGFWALSDDATQPQSQRTLLDSQNQARDWYFASVTLEESNSIEGSLIGDGWLAVSDSDAANEVVGSTSESETV
jgi:Bacterial Ig domain/YDG domain/Bacterial cadherin-like domain